MKNLVKLFRRHFLFIVFLLILLTLLYRGKIKAAENTGLSKPAVTADSLRITNFLNQIVPGADVVIVQSGASIQDALDNCSSPACIFVGPGIYRETLTITKPNIRIIGIPMQEGEQVILENPGSAEKAIIRRGSGADARITNIQLHGFREKEPLNPLPGSVKENSGNLITEIRRDDLGEGIAHYTFRVPLGPDPYDDLVLHRVVLEEKAFHPVQTAGNVFMIHGSIQDFEDIFLKAGAEIINDKTSSPFYLAQNKIDVWGIDLAWTRVPAEINDFNFMQNWGVARDGDDVLKSLAIVRLIRGLTQQGLSGINVLGFSYGLVVAYDIAGRETQQHEILRDIKGLIPVDHAMKYAPEDEVFRQNACKLARTVRDSLERGIYQTDDGISFIGLGTLAMTAPGKISPIPDFAAMEFTNRQVLLFLAAKTYASGNPMAPFWHFFGGDPDDLYYTDANRFIRLAASLSPYQPKLQDYEASACLCNEEKLGIDAHLSEIKLPILYLGTRGGMGSHGIYTTSLTASRDISSHIVSIPGTEVAEDFGHGDLWLGKEAAGLVWKVLLDWLISHNTD